MSTLTNSPTDGSETRHRTLYVALWIVGALALGTLAAAGYPLAGVALYVAAVLAAVAVWARYPQPMFDERDDEIHRVAGGHTLALVGCVSAIVFPGLTALYGLGHFTWGPATTAVAFTVAGLYLTYGVVSAVVSSRR